MPEEQTRFQRILNRAIELMSSTELDAPEDVETAVAILAAGVACHKELTLPIPAILAAIKITRQGG